MDTPEDFDSLDPDSGGLRELGYQAVDMMADHFAQVREVNTFSAETPPEVADEFEVLQEPNLFSYSFRYLPADLRNAVADADHREAVSEYVDQLSQRIDTAEQERVDSNVTG